MNEKIKDFLQRSLGYFIVVLVAAAYICTAFIQIDETGKSVTRIIADGAIVFLFGFFINRSFDLQGIMDGEKNDRFQSSYILHGETVVKISPHIDRLDEWCRIKNEENLKVQRTRILASEGLAYSNYFNEDGSAKDITIDESKLKNKYTKRIERRRIACFDKALHLKLTPLTAGELTSEGTKAQDPYDFGRTKQEYEKQRGLYDIISKVVIAAIFGYYGVSLIQDFSYATLIWNCLQVAIFVLVGSINMYNSYLFITGEYRGRIVKKISHLEMFDNYVKNTPPEEVALSEEEEKEKPTEVNEDE